VVPLADARARPRRVAIGKFDGLHLGHRAVVSGADTVCTFDPHPAAVLNPDGAPPLLTDLERRAQLVGALGVEELVVLPFDDAMRSLSPEDFVEQVLLGRLGATHVHVGAGFRFGHRAAGSAATLAADPRLECRIVEAVTAGGAAVSSTRVRALVGAGAVADAAVLLGAPHGLRCTVKRSEAGWLTLAPPAGLALPPAGVYSCVLRGPERRSAPAGCQVEVRPAPERALRLAPTRLRALPGAAVLVEFLGRGLAAECTAAAPARTPVAAGQAA
jgi:riboflavin kinase/FMN adenylyltransferase